MAEEKYYAITFTLKFRRTNDDSNDLDPTLEELEQYVSSSEIIPQNPYYHVDGIIGEVAYVGNLSFKFTCFSAQTAAALTDTLINQSMADGEWEACPGNGSFVYPTKADNPEDAEELGVLMFESVAVSLV